MVTVVVTYYSFKSVSTIVLWFSFSYVLDYKATRYIRQHHIETEGEEEDGDMVRRWIGVGQRKHVLYRERLIVG